jgi:hypothetical protein
MCKEEGLLNDDLDHHGDIAMDLSWHQSIGTLIPLLWPIFKWRLQSPVRIANKPMFNDVLPGPVLWAGCTVWMSNWHPWNHEAGGRERL